MSDPNLSSFIWSVADLLRGDYKQSEYGNSPDLKTELLSAIMGALDAHGAMSKQALNSPTVQSGMKDILLNHARLWETGPHNPEAVPVAAGRHRSADWGLSPRSSMGSERLMGSPQTGAGARRQGQGRSRLPSDVSRQTPSQD